MTARKKDVSDVDAISCFAWISWNGPDSAWTFVVAPPWTFEVAHLASVFVLTPHATGDAIYPPVAELMLSALRYD
jgi:hypothetical protein